jgi:uncharacterized protein (DUF488 family)
MPTAPSSSQSASPIYTIGHGNRPLDELARLLKLHSISCVVDVRAFPGSRRHPHFGREALERSLFDARVRYVWEGKALGGRRRGKRDSPHVAMRNDSFRAYADHMESGEFQEGIGRLLAISASERPAIMCAERLPWQCHRFMISDYLAAAGIEVLHVIDASAPQPHTLRVEVRLSEGRLIYDGQTQSELGLD